VTLLKNIILILMNIFFCLNLTKIIHLLLNAKTNYKNRIKNKLIIYITLSLACILYLFQLYFSFTKDSVFSVILLMLCALIYSTNGIIKKQNKTI